MTNSAEHSELCWRYQFKVEFLVLESLMHTCSCLSGIDVNPFFKRMGSFHCAFVQKLFIGIGVRDSKEKMKVLSKTHRTVAFAHDFLFIDYKQSDLLSRRKGWIFSEANLHCCAGPWLSNNTLGTEAEGDSETERYDCHLEISLALASCADNQCAGNAVCDF